MNLSLLKSVSSINWLRCFSAVHSRLTRHRRTQGASITAGFVLCLVVSGPAVAGPEGGVIREGNGTITDQGRGPKLTIFKMKRRKGYRRKMGHRQDYTEIRVDSIES